MFAIETIAAAADHARQACLPGREAVEVAAVFRAAICCSLPHPASPHRRRLTMARPKKTPAIVVPIKHERISQPHTDDYSTNIALDQDIINRYRKAAASRRTTVPRLLNDILLTIDQDHLLEAVLADRPPFD
jgi:hypothetical protein